MNTDDMDLQIKTIYRTFFDPCKSAQSVLSVVRFGILCKAVQRRIPARYNRCVCIFIA
jgi:hypothetical protein